MSKEELKTEWKRILRLLDDKRVRFISAFNNTVQIDKERNNLEDLRREALIKSK
jgi:hypothetical protein